MRALHSLCSKRLSCYSWLSRSSSDSHTELFAFVSVMSPAQDLAVVWESLSSLWHSIQVELHGVYSVEQLHRLENYHHETSWIRAVVVCLLMPVPCILVVILLDLFPLEHPSHGPDSPMVWIRAFLTATGVTWCLLEQFRHHLRMLELSRRVAVFISVMAGAMTAAPAYWMALLIGYPLPFMMILSTPPASSTLVALLFFFQRRQFRANPGIIRDLLGYNIILVCQISMTIVYPLYNHVFTQLSSSQQTAFVFILPLLKILYKIWIHRALRDADDAKPEAIIFNVEVFHALFVAYCMQGATSKRTVAALMLIDAVQAWIAYVDIRSILVKAQPIAQKLDRASPSSKALHNLLQITTNLTTAEPDLFNYATARRQLRTRKVTIIEPNTPKTPNRIPGETTSYKPPSGARVAPQPIVQDPPSESGCLEPIMPQTKTVSPHFVVLSRVERGVFVHQTLQLFYLTEFLVLIEYTEVIMPLIYSIYVTVISQMRNRTYYQFLQGLTSDQLGPTLANVSLYTSLEFVSLVLVALGLWYRLRFSLLHQLAFVLETRQANVQAKLVLWVLYVVQNAITQYGADYTFQFAWLRQKSTPRPPMSLALRTPKQHLA